MPSAACYIEAPKDAIGVEAIIKATRSEAVKRLGGRGVKVVSASERGITWTREWQDKAPRRKKST